MAALDEHLSQQPYEYARAIMWVIKSQNVHCVYLRVPACVPAQARPTRNGLGVAWADWL